MKKVGRPWPPGPPQFRRPCGKFSAWSRKCASVNEAETSEVKRRHFAAIPPDWLVPPAPRVAFAEGQTVNLTCQTQAAPRADVSWEKDGVHLTGGRYHVKMNGNLEIVVSDRNFVMN